MVLAGLIAETAAIRDGFAQRVWFGTRGRHTPGRSYINRAQDPGGRVVAGVSGRSACLEGRRRGTDGLMMWRLSACLAPQGPQWRQVDRHTI